MKRHARAATIITSQWPRVIAESIGLRAPAYAPRVPQGAIPDRDRWEASRFAACWLGHATALLRLGESTVLTDPVFEDRAGVRIGGRQIGRLRSTALPAHINALPPVDIVLLSHAHFDHWCRASLERLANQRTVAVIPARTRRLLPRGFGHVIELATDDSVDLDGLHITAMRVNHWGARYLIDRRRGCNAYLIELDAARRARTLFAGDTAHTHGFDVLSTTGGSGGLSTDSAGGRGVDLAILGIGGYRWERHHCTPEQAAQMARRMGARRIMPIHHGTFRDAHEPIDEPLQRLRAAWEKEGTGELVSAEVGCAWWGDS